VKSKKLKDAPNFQIVDKRCATTLYTSVKMRPLKNISSKDAPIFQSTMEKMRHIVMDQKMRQFSSCRSFFNRNSFVPVFRNARNTLSK